MRRLREKKKRDRHCKIKNPDLQTWINLNDALRNADEAFCTKLIKEETAGRKRRAFIRRIHCRLNKVRADRERRELLITT